ncbi:type IV pilus biogenesis/stability protein PilW [Paraglaciecola aquimarina]|uniref:Type IV pilus biogenesis/stability protein PilW n=1 Tax=Paraglaciecola aquimarina TaxID=1235557 RepID=A0ABU3SWN3_9ALTE|nr:type IV pilus biogenesis/stability protein PilW [Paraglaciecola aquimarina]MDU0354410.1 type IV pilus biogenesis/stability protein PilW [Paraglaciecola aquimarina]
MFKLNGIFCLLALLFHGCSSQNSWYSAANEFDQVKAAETRVSLGLSYLKAGQYSQAKFNLDKAFEFAPSSAEVNYALAYYYQQVEEREQAESKYRLAMDLDPENANISNSYGAFLCAQGQYQAAKPYFLKAINSRQYTASAETYENLALCSQSAGYPNEMIGYLHSAVNHDPSRSQSVILLVEALIDAQQWQEARDVLRRYEKVAQVSPQSLLLAIEIEKSSGNKSAEKDYTDMLIKVYPLHPEVIALVKENKTQIQQSRRLKKQVNVQQTHENEVQQALTPSSKNASAIDDVSAAEENSSSLASINGSKSQLPRYHVVSEGENLFRISLMYNIKLQRLRDWNNLSNSSAIYNGMKLTLNPLILTSKVKV